MPSRSGKQGTVRPSGHTDATSGEEAFPHARSQPGGAWSG